ncbi:uncharacterized protein LOC123690024 [Pieris rapae]|uniref:uncharacterized protein LOC123690024 n=1 Tax=Pieris rapae TaxID=64459 RepID=UPI001E27A377|nr:uncharacterized protein LOC123690024 [Pieris rapae]
MFREVFTIYGYCCQFDVNYFTEFSGNDTNLAAGVLKLEALDIIVNSMKVYPNGTVRDGYVMLYIFDQQNQLSLVDSPISLVPATYFDVSIDVWVIEAEDEIKNLQLGNDAQRHMRTIISQRECYQTCDYVQYETKTDYTKPMTIKSRKKENSGFSRVTVHFAHSICIKYIRKVRYTWDQMLANLGGIFGLCLGGSIISIIELLWFIFDLLATLFHYLCTKEESRVVKKAWKKNKNSIVPKYPFIN